MEARNLLLGGKMWSCAADQKVGFWNKIGSRKELGAPALWKRKMKCREIKDCEEQVEYTDRYMYRYGLQACGGSQGQVLQHVQCALHVAGTTDVICLQGLPVSHKSAYPGITYRQVRDWLHLVGNWSRTGSPLPFFYHDISIVNIQQSTINLILMRQIHYKNL